MNELDRQILTINNQYIAELEQELEKLRKIVLSDKPTETLKKKKTSELRALEEQDPLDFLFEEEGRT